jgi:positive regulator of sigma E activity
MVVGIVGIIPVAIMAWYAVKTYQRKQEKKKNSSLG